MGISKDLTEEDIKFRYINEAITSKGWSKDSIFMEQKVKFTDGKISLMVILCIERNQSLPTMYFMQIRQHPLLL